MATAGYLPAIMHPRAWICKLDPLTGRGAPWPIRGGVRLTNATVPPNWYRWWGMTNGIQTNIIDPQANIQTSDRGILSQVSTGAHGIGVASQSKSPIRQFIEWFNKLGKYSISATGGVAEVQTLTVSGTATAPGSAVIVLNDAVYEVPIASGDTAAVAAGKLRVIGNYSPVLSGWGLSGATADAIYTASSAGSKTGLFAATFPPGLTGSFVETTPGTNPIYAPGDTMFFDPNGEYGSVQRFSMLIEGVAPAGSWADEALLIRLILHQINQGGTNALRMDDSGTDANTQVTLAGQCEPRAVSALEMLNTGFTIDKQDPYGKMTWWVANQLAA